MVEEEAERSEAVQKMHKKNCVQCKEKGKRSYFILPPAGTFDDSKVLLLKLEHKCVSILKLKMLEISAVIKWGESEY